MLIASHRAASRVTLPPSSRITHGDRFSRQTNNRDCWRYEMKCESALNSRTERQFV
jgi:hypothetical protein